MAGLYNQKVSQFDSVANVADADVLMVVSSGANKKATRSALMSDTIATSGVQVIGEFKHMGSGLGFFGAHGKEKIAVTGSVAGGTAHALDQLLAALGSYGLITDSTT